MNGRSVSDRYDGPEFDAFLRQVASREERVDRLFDRDNLRNAVVIEQERLPAPDDDNTPKD